MGHHYCSAFTYKKPTGTLPASVVVTGVGRGPRWSGVPAIEVAGWAVPCVVAISVEPAGAAERKICATAATDVTGVVVAVWEKVTTPVVVTGMVVRVVDCCIGVTVGLML